MSKVVAEFTGDARGPRYSVEYWDDGTPGIDEAQWKDLGLYAWTIEHATELALRAAGMHQGKTRVIDAWEG